MLILTRKKDEVIVINGNIRVQIVDIRADGVKVGIDAPNTIKVYRQELWESIQAENIKAVEEGKKHQSIAEKLGEKLGSGSDVKKDADPDEGK